MGDLSILLEEILRNPWVVLVGYILSIVSLILAILFYFKGKKEKKPKYFVTSRNLIRNYSSLYKMLSIKYNETPIDNFTVSTVTFWNEGKETIHGSDITSTEPILVKALNGKRIVDIEILYRSNNANQLNAQISGDSKYITITFDYLDYMDGVVIQVFHTGTSSDDICLLGTVKGYGQIDNYYPKKRNFSIGSLLC